MAVVIYLLIAVATLVYAQPVEVWTIQELAVLLLAGWGFILALKELGRKEGKGWLLTPLDPGFLVFLVVVLAASLFSTNQQESFFYFRRLLGLWFIFYTSLFLGQEPGRTRRVVLFMVLAGVALAFWALVETALLSIAHRPMASQTNPNHLAAFLTICVLLAIPVLLNPGDFFKISSRNQRLARLSVLLGLTLFFCVILLTQSRGAVCGLGAGLAVYCSSKRFRKEFIAAKLYWLAIPVVLAAGFMAWPLVKRVFIDQEALAYSRVLLWKSAWQMFLAHPWLGAGPGAFSDVYPKYRDSSLWLYATPFAHNEYLQILAEAGLLGLASFLWLAAVLLKEGVSQAYAARPAEAGQGWLGLSLLACLVAGFVQALVEFNFHPLALAVSYTVLAGLLVSLTPRRGPFLPKEKAGRAPLAVVFVVICFSFVTLAWAISNLAYMAGYYDSQKQNPDQAIVWFERATQFSPMFAQAYNSLGKEYSQKAWDLEKGVKANPPQGPKVQNPEAADYLRQAEKALFQAVSLNPSQYEYFNSLAEFYRDQNRLDEAVLMMDKTIRLNPNHPLPYFAKAKYLEGLNRWPEAIQTLGQAKGVEPNLPMIYQELAKCYQHTHQKKLSQENQQKAAELTKQLSLP